MHGILHGGKEEKGNVETTFIKNEIICSKFSYTRQWKAQNLKYIIDFILQIYLLWIASVWMKGIMLHVCAYKFDIL